LDSSNLILLVATPDILAVYQVKTSLDILQSLHFPLKMVRLILNRAESPRRCCLAGSQECPGL
jgi:Flp pilus assembly CpaE family ATPase